MSLFDPGRNEPPVVRAHALVDEAIDTYVTRPGKTVAGVVCLVSGGNDSTLLLHLMRERVTHVGHCNTTIGIDETRQFVRDLCSSWELPLLEVTPPRSYRELVIEQGFPGPAMHFKMYQRLKERSIRQIRRQIITYGHRQRVLFLAGRRRYESDRRMSIPRLEIEDSMVWVSPLWDWTDDDMAAYRAANEVPRNPVTDHLHMSGECLCGSFAAPGELDEIAFFYPAVAAEIRELEAEVRAAGHPEPLCQWGWGSDESNKDLVRTGRMCSSCDARQLGFGFEDSPSDYGSY